MTTTVCIHMGHAKTGTSAIQIALVRNRNLLAEHGVVYPSASSDERAEKGLITAGNGSFLRKLLGPDERPNQQKRARTQLQRLIESHDGRTLLFSSEILTGCNPEQFVALCEFVRACGAEIKVIYYVRHLMDIALSTYSQAVKRSVERRSFEKWVGRYRNPFVRVLAMIASAAGSTNCTIRLYDKEKGNLVKSFFSLFPGGEHILRNQLSEFADNRQSVNRSLTIDETAIMQFVNDRLNKFDRKASKAMAARISDQLLLSCGAGGERAIVTARELQILTENNSHVPPFVNAFVDGAFELQFKSDEIVIGERRPPFTSSNDPIFQSIVSTLLDCGMQQMMPS
jgi:hypothetical protein